MTSWTDSKGTPISSIEAIKEVASLRIGVGVSRMTAAPWVAEAYRLENECRQSLGESGFNDFQTFVDALTEPRYRSNMLIAHKILDFNIKRLVSR